MLHIELRPGESVKIGDATVTLVKKSGQLARLSIDASKDVNIQREMPSNNAAAIAAKNGISGIKL